MQQPCLFVPWKTVAEQVGIPAVQAVPLPNLRDGVLHAVNLLPEPQQQEFRAAYTDAVESIPTLAESVETLAPLILEDRVKNASQNHLWALVLKHMADHHGFWLTTATAPPPNCVQIHCGGLGGGALGGSDAPTFDCTNPRVDGACVYGPSLAPVDRPGEKITGVAAGATTCLHELAMLISLTVQPCKRWQELGFGRASILYRRTQNHVRGSEAVAGAQEVTSCDVPQWALVETLSTTAGAYCCVSPESATKQP